MSLCIVSFCLLDNVEDLREYIKPFQASVSIFPLLKVEGSSFGLTAEKTSGTSLASLFFCYTDQVTDWHWIIYLSLVLISQCSPIIMIRSIKSLRSLSTSSSPSFDFDLSVVGGGIVGLAAAQEIQGRYPGNGRQAKGVRVTKMDSALSAFNKRNVVGKR